MILSLFSDILYLVNSLHWFGNLHVLTNSERLSCSRVSSIFNPYRATSFVLKLSSVFSRLLHIFKCTSHGSKQYEPWFGFGAVLSGYILFAILAIKEIKQTIGPYEKKFGQSELLFMKSFPISVIGVCSLSLLYASGIQGAKGLGIEPIISAGEISEETSEHLGIMAYAARFLNLSPSDITYQHSYNETRVSLITVSNINGDFAETVTLMNHL